MDALKTWILIILILTAGFFGLAWSQARQTVRVQAAEIARLKAHPAEPAAVPQTTAPASGRPALELDPTAPPAEDSDPNVAVQALVAMTAERDRYKDGLQRCVDEANHLAHDTGRRFELPPVPMPASAPSASRTEHGPRSYITSNYQAPTVVPLDDMHVKVTGNLFNMGTLDGKVQAVITLMRDGKPVSTAQETVFVPAQGQTMWSHTFPWTGQEGSWSATVRVEKLE